MTLEQYIMNPYPNGVISAQSREMTRNMYIDKFSKTMLREAGNDFPVRFFQGKSSWFLHIKVPSEAIPNFTYDVVFEFLQVKNTLKLEDCETRFYSNDPAFVYTYANTFKDHKMFCEELTSKMPKEALKTKAHEKNPSNIVGYVKSIYFAYLLCKRKNYFSRTIFESRARGYSKKELEELIMPADLKIAQRQSAQYEIDKQKRLEKSKNDIYNKTSMNQVLNPEVQTGLKKTRTVKSISSSKSRINSVKRTKRI